MVQDPVQLSALEWTVRASVSDPAWQQVPEPLRARVQAGVPATVPGCRATKTPRAVAAGAIVA